MCGVPFADKTPTSCPMCGMKVPFELRFPRVPQPADVVACKCRQSRALRDLVCAAAPMTWVVNRDLDRAQEWERRAARVLAEEE